ncbi:MAG: hypothetical protein ACRDB0_03075 [Paraclostridium sp.]
MEKKIKYTIVPNTNPDDAMAKVLISKDIIYTNMMIIENAALGITIDPDLTDLVKIATEKNLDDVMKKTASSSDCDCIILNGFNIDLDSARDKFIDFAIEYDVYLCINVISKKQNFDKNVTIYLDYDVKDLEDNEWSNTKKDINDAINKKVESIDDSSIGETMLKAILNQGLKGSLDKEMEDIDIDIAEEYHYSNSTDEITVQKLTDDSIIIGDGVNEVIIGESVVKFLITSLQNLN